MAPSKHYATTLIEDGGKRYNRGDVVPASLDGLDELVDAGAVSTTKPEDETPEGDRDINVADGGTAKETRV